MPLSRAGAKLAASEYKALRCSFEPAVRMQNVRSARLKTVAAPWADKHSQGTLLFEPLTLNCCKPAATCSGAALLDLDWQTAHSIMQLVVQRGLKRRSVGA